jgi:hypothetical protein
MFTAALKAGPTGGDGFAAPPLTWFNYFTNFFSHFLKFNITIITKRL